MPHHQPASAVASLFAPLQSLPQRYASKFHLLSSAVWLFLQAMAFAALLFQAQPHIGSLKPFHRLGQFLQAPAKPSPDDIVVVSAVRTPLCKAKVGGLKVRLQDGVLTGILTW